MVLVILGLTRQMADTPPEADARLDLVGTGLSALGLGLIVYGILRSGTWGFVQAKSGAPEWLGLSPVVWLILSGGAVLLLFLAWENRRILQDRSSLIITVCNIGEKSLYAMLLLKSLGYQNVKNIQGGLNAWISEGLPTESGQG